MLNLNNELHELTHKTVYINGKKILIPVDPVEYKKYKLEVIKTMMVDNFNLIKKALVKKLRINKIIYLYRFILSKPPKAPETDGHPESIKGHIDENGYFHYNYKKGGKMVKEKYTTPCFTDEENNAILKEWEKGKQSTIKFIKEMLKEKGYDDDVQESILERCFASENDVKECLDMMIKLKESGNTDPKKEHLDNITEKMEAKKRAEAEWDKPEDKSEDEPEKSEDKSEDEPEKSED